ncbi:MAG: hypothetical protein O4861_09715 [Trichodesmium sp. St16_bin4-tuft]|nr:hypothetical protein [Trichodesmium sp. MAG_R01]MDE5072379.1 hypothetical protein [Trichodesmium sp. St5_bin8]MDE5098597.1 hypothetical protein [Trichodesmium sp. St16_bin4-tuft]MDE5105494.1 hypothetical protein [Trichodesmium sp. St19_bin2]
MKYNSKNYGLDADKKVYQKSPHPFLLALILTGILAAEAYPNLTETAIAAVKVFQYPQLEKNGKIISNANNFSNLFNSLTQTKSDANTEIFQPFFLTSINDVKKFNEPRSEELEKIANQSKKIPNDIVEVVRQDLASKIGIAPEKIKVIGVTQETWPNTCLGLPKNDELCGQMLVEGWRLILSHDKGKWIYRTDNLGRLMRVELKK